MVDDVYNCISSGDRVMITRKFIDDLCLELFQSDMVPMPPAGPVRDSFVGYVSTDHVNTFIEMPGFIPIECYHVSPYPTVANEIGCAGNMRIVISNDVPNNKIRCEAITIKEFELPKGE